MRSCYRFLLLIAANLALASLAGGQASPTLQAENLESAGALSELERQAEDRFAEDDLEGAIVLYRRLADRSQRQRERTRVLMTVAYLEHLLDRDRDAITTVRDVLIEDPDFHLQPELYNETFTGIFYEGQKLAAESRRSLAERFVRQGNDHLRQGDYGAARQQFEAALVHRGNHPAALYNLALVNLYEKREEDAEAGFQRLLSLGESIEARTRALALTNLGYLYERRRQYLEAEGFLEQAVAIDASNAQAWSILGASRRQQGKKTTAAEAFRRAYELSPDDSQVMSNLALAYVDAEEWQPAVELLEKATAKDPGSAGHWLNLGRARLGVGDNTGAVAAFDSAMRHDPEDAGGWASNAATHLALHYYEAGNYPMTLEQAERALAWREDQITARIYQGLAFEALGDLAGARQSLEDARRRDPTRADTHNNLGSVYFQLGLYDQATEAFERALAIQADFPGARENLEAVKQARTQPRRPPTAVADAPRGSAPATPTPSLGVRFADIDYAALGLKGAMVDRVIGGSPAARAGLRKRDLILKVDGRDVLDAGELERYVASRPLGSIVTLSLLRDNAPQRIDVRLQ